MPTAEEWNAAHPIGTVVHAWPGTRDGAGIRTKTRSRAWTLGHGAAVVAVEGYPGGIDLAHIDPADVLNEVERERRRQDGAWGRQNHEDGTGLLGDDAAAREAQRHCAQRFLDRSGTWRDILSEEVAEAYAETDSAKLRAELVQVAAVAVAWIEAIDRRSAR